MPYRVLIAADARRDMEVLFSYLAAHESPAAADRILTALQRACATLREQPMRGRIPAEMQLIGRNDYREIGYKLYRVIYRIEGDDVVVYGVADGRRDMQSFLYHRLVR